MKVSIHLLASVASGQPKVKLSSRHDDSNAVIRSLQDGEMHIEADLDLAEIDEIRVTFFDKEPSPNPDKDTFIDIKNLYVDDINLQHFIYDKGVQWPRYDKNFMEQYNPPDFYQPGCKMFLNGIWVIPIHLPIWKYLLESYYA
jgi:hypothetical protein